VVAHAFREGTDDGDRLSRMRPRHEPRGTGEQSFAARGQQLFRAAKPTATAGGEDHRIVTDLHD
jgi:hypothetical protein